MSERIFFAVTNPVSVHSDLRRWLRRPMDEDQKKALADALNPFAKKDQKCPENSTATKS